MGSRSESLLRGRGKERAQLAHLIAGLHEGVSAALVVSGQPGVGKTFLLEDLVRSDTGCRIEHAAGVESEMELAYAGLHQLCAPMLGCLDRLPAAHREAVCAAFGLATGLTPDPFFLGLAVLGLFTEVADDRPLIVIVDDSQWLDRSSAQVLAFVARRLRTESVALIFGVRESRPEFAGLSELALEGLADSDARDLLQDTIRRPLDPRVRERIIAEARGNPLALIELSRDGGRSLAGGFAVPGPAQLSGRLEQRFLDDALQLPAETQELLLLAAAEPLGDPALLRRAAGEMGLSLVPEVVTETAGLIEFGPRVRFRHPLIRSAVYGAAIGERRRAVHRALGEATDIATDLDRRVWHLAQSVEETDEGIAEELEHSAARARERGGWAAVGAILARSASLTADPARSARRLLEAAIAEHQSGAPETAEALLASAEMGPLTDFDRARGALLRAMMSFDRTRGRGAPELLLAAARQLAAFDIPLARVTYLEAFNAVRYAVPYTTVSPQEVVAAVPPLPTQSGPPRLTDLVLDAWTTLVKRGYREGTPLVRKALAAFREQQPIPVEDMRGAWTAISPCAETWDIDGWTFISESLVAGARDAGSLPLLSLLLVALGGANLNRGLFRLAETQFEEAISVAIASGLPPPRYVILLMHSWRGEREATLRLAAEVMHEARLHGEGFAQYMAEIALVRLHNGLGEYEAAVAAVPDWMERTVHVMGGLLFGELIEAAARCGQSALAHHTLELMIEQTQASATDWALGEEALARALLSDGADVPALYEEAIERLGRAGMPLLVARARLLYGEWLRREGQRVDARAQLRVAHEQLSAMSLHAYADRAARELKATGVTSRQRTLDASDELTPQERQIAQMAAEGMTNREIGQKLFLSHRTVGSHLYRIFPKLRINSRSELASALLTADGRN